MRLAKTREWTRPKSRDSRLHWFPRASGHSDFGRAVCATPYWMRRKTVYEAPKR